MGLCKFCNREVWNVEIHEPVCFKQYPPPDPKDMWDCLKCKRKMCWQMYPTGGEATGEFEPCEKCGKYAFAV